MGALYWMDIGTTVVTERMAGDGLGSTVATTGTPFGASTISERRRFRVLGFSVTARPTLAGTNTVTLRPSAGATAIGATTTEFHATTKNDFYGWPESLGITYGAGAGLPAVLPALGTSLEAQVPLEGGVSVSPGFTVQQNAAADWAIRVFFVEDNPRLDLVE